MGSHGGEHGVVERRVSVVPIIGEPLRADLDNFIAIKLPLVKRNGRPCAEILKFSDFHYGHRDQLLTFLHRYIEFVRKNPHIRAEILGDLFELQDLAPFLKESEKPQRLQIESFIEDFTPIAKQLKIILMGNHDMRFAKAVSNTINLIEYLKLKLGNPHIFTVEPGRGVLAAYKVGKLVYSDYMMHGDSSATVNYMGQLKRAALNFRTDIVSMGHNHKMCAEPYTHHTVAKVGGKLCRLIYRTYLMSCGCFIGYPAYAEKKSSPINDPGAYLLRLYADRPGIEIIDTRTAFHKELYPHNGTLTIEGKTATKTRAIRTGRRKHE